MFRSTISTLGLFFALLVVSNAADVNGTDVGGRCCGYNPCHNNGRCVNLGSHNGCECRGTGAYGDYCENVFVDQSPLLATAEPSILSRPKPADPAAPSYDYMRNTWTLTAPKHDGVKKFVIIQTLKVRWSASCNNDQYFELRKDTSSNVPYFRSTPDRPATWNPAFNVNSTTVVLSYFSSSASDTFDIKYIGGDYCTGVTCQHGGTCSSGETTFTCKCTPGFDGEFCEHTKSECDIHNYCESGSLCVPNKEDYGEGGLGGRTGLGYDCVCNCGVCGVKQSCGANCPCEPFCHGAKQCR